MFPDFLSIAWIDIRDYIELDLIPVIYDSTNAFPWPGSELRIDLHDQITEMEL